MNTSSSTKTFGKDVGGRTYTITYIDPSLNKEEKEQEKGKIASQLYDIFAKYYDNEKQSGAV